MGLHDQTVRTGGRPSDQQKRQRGAAFGLNQDTTFFALSHRAGT
jgi:hypothetical protein